MAGLFGNNEFFEGLRNAINRGHQMRLPNQGYDLNPFDSRGPRPLQNPFANVTGYGGTNGKPQAAGVGYEQGPGAMRDPIKMAAMPGMENVFVHPETASAARRVGQPIPGYTRDGMSEQRVRNGGVNLARVRQKLERQISRDVIRRPLMRGMGKGY